MTLFAYRFPIDLVFLIMDVLFIDGVDSLVIFSLAIIGRSVDVLTTMEFENLLQYLKSDVIKPYIDAPHTLINDYKQYCHLTSRLSFHAKQHQKNLQCLQIDSESTKNLQTELYITKAVLNSMKADLNNLNTEYMNLSKKYDRLCIELERANTRADNAESKLSNILDSMCTSESVTDKNDNDELYTERLIKKNISIVSENFHLKQKLDRIMSKINSIKLDNDQNTSGNDSKEY